jgi:hypothetical protein
MEYAHTHAQEHIAGFLYIYGRSDEHIKIRYAHEHAHSFTKITQSAHKLAHEHITRFWYIYIYIYMGVFMSKLKSGIA